MVVVVTKGCYYNNAYYSTADITSGIANPSSYYVTSYNTAYAQTIQDFWLYSTHYECKTQRFEIFIETTDSSVDPPVTAYIAYDAVKHPMFTWDAATKKISM